MRLATHDHRLRRRARIVWLVAAVALVLVAAAAWRWVPRPHTPATDEMRAAMNGLVAEAATMSAPPDPPANPRTDRERLLAHAYSLRGVPYDWGAKGPDAYDCSGFTKAAYDAAGIELPDGSFNQAEGEQPLSSVAVLTPGDIIVYRWVESKGVTHVTLYAGDGWVIGTGTPGKPKEVICYPLADDLVADGRVITYRHIVLADEQ